uniref:Heterokaryon incompatibility domain-containing protein n=1 Tax=Bionectria ochroleuca TaxID=29856 RepID=A0A8H7TQ05_BIOOC
MDFGEIEGMDVADLLQMYTSAQVQFAEALANDSIPLQIEIATRSVIAEASIKLGVYLSRQPLLEDAVQHLDAILRRIPQVSPDRVYVLNKLCEAEYELYCLTGSQRPLDDSVTYGRQANDVPLFGSTVRAEEEPPDLEDSIACKREILRKIRKDSERYLTTINNLASSLRLRYLCTLDEENEREAIDLFRELLSSAEPGTKLHGMAIGQLGASAAMKFRVEKNPEVLDEAIANCNVGLEVNVPGQDGWLEMLSLLVELCTEKFNHTGDLEDMETLVHNSCRFFDSIPTSHHKKGDQLLAHLKRLRECAFTVKDVGILKNIIDKGRIAFESMPVDYPDKARSQLEYSHILGHQYFLSGSLQHLICLVEYALVVSDDFNGSTRASSSLQAPEVNVYWYPNLVSSLKVLAEASAENSMRQLAEGELLARFKSSYNFENRNYAFMALDELYEYNATRLRILATVAADGVDLINEEIEEKISELSLGYDEPVEEEDEMEKTLREIFNMVPGQRLVNIDPRNGHMVFDIKDYVKAQFLKDDTPRSPSELLANDERLEQKLFRKAGLAGRRTNPGLCYWCQWLCRILDPEDVGFDFVAEDSSIPSIGHWKTILFRKSECAVCNLAASLITTAKGQLHTYFDKIEERGKRIRYTLGRLSDGEGVLRVDVGLSYAGELRLLTPKNFREALRQAWEDDTNTPLALETLLEDVDGPVNDNGGQQIDFRLMRRWLKDLTGTTSDQYFVLSYTWGKVNMHMTLLENVEERKRPGALSSVPFPKTIKDAIDVTRSLGERLLWIDAICIVQDDASQKARDIPNMDIVYGRAHATIVALHGDNADAGLPGVSPGTRACQQIETIDLTLSDEDEDNVPQEKGNRKCRFVRGPSPLPLALQASTWNTRGWILQERLLSKRCIYFSADAFYFECNRGNSTEGGVNEDYTSFFAGEIFDDREVQQRPKQDNPISDLAFMYDLEASPRLWKAWGYIKNWYRCIASVNSPSSQTSSTALLVSLLYWTSWYCKTTLRALWFMDCPRASSSTLLWTPAAKIPRRGQKLPTQPSDTDIGQPDLRFPSWSWAGWDGPVDFRLFEAIKDASDRPLPLVRKFKLDGQDIYPDKWKKAVQAWLEIEEKGRNAPSNGFTKEGDNPQALGNPNPATRQESNNTRELDSSKSMETKEKLIEQGTAEDSKLIETKRASPVVSFRSFSLSPTEEYLCLTDQVHTKGPQSVRQIRDSSGAHCGLWWSQGGNGWTEDDLYLGHEKKLALVGISTHESCERPLQGPGSVQGPIALWDSDMFPEVGPQSGWVNVLVIDQESGYENGVSTRCTVAIIHNMAWEQAKPVQTLVRIA